MAHTMTTTTSGLVTVFDEMNTTWEGLLNPVEELEGGANANILDIVGKVSASFIGISNHLTKYNVTLDVGHSGISGGGILQSNLCNNF